MNVLPGLLKRVCDHLFRYVTQVHVALLTSLVSSAINPGKSLGLTALSVSANSSKNRLKYFVIKVTEQGVFGLGLLIHCKFEHLFI